MADELDRAAAGGRSALGLVYERAALLPVSPRGEARHFRLGAGQPGPRCRGGRGSSEASVRFLLHQIFLAVAGRAHPVPHHQDDADRLRLAIAADPPSVGSSKAMLLKL